MPDYSQGKIYKIVNTKNNKVYIGSTTQRLNSRMSNHRSLAIRLNAEYGKLYKSMRFHGVEKFQIKLVKDYPCKTKEQLLEKEFQIIRQYVTKGIVLYNTVIEEGKHSNDTRKKMSARARGSGNNNYGKVGTASALFRRGCVRFSQSEKWPRWVFEWRDNRKPKSKSFSSDKFGYDEAKRLAEEYQNIIFPIE